MAPHNAMEECAMPQQKNSKTQDARTNHSNLHTTEATTATAKQADCPPPQKQQPLQKNTTTTAKMIAMMLL